MDTGAAIQGVQADRDRMQLENEKLVALVAKLQKELDDAHRKEMHARWEGEQQARKETMQGEEEARQKLSEEWGRMQDERVLLERDKQHAERILFEANEAAREVRERMKESMNASMTLSSRAGLPDASAEQVKDAQAKLSQMAAQLNIVHQRAKDSDVLVAELQGKLANTRQSLRLTEERLKEETQLKDEALQQVEELKMEVAEGVALWEQDAMRVSDAIRKHKQVQPDPLLRGEVEGVFESKSRNHQLLNKACRHLHFSARKAVAASFHQWRENSFEAIAGRKQAAKLLKRKLMAGQAAAFDRWVQVWQTGLWAVVCLRLSPPTPPFPLSSQSSQSCISPCPNLARTAQGSLVGWP